MDEALADKELAERWCRVVGIPKANAAHLIDYIRGIEAKDAEQLAAWRAEQDADMTTHPILALSDDQKEKVTRLLAFGAIHTPFGQALEKSEAWYSAYLRHLIATESPRSFSPDFTWAKKD